MSTSVIEHKSTDKARIERSATFQGENLDAVQIQRAIRIVYGLNGINDSVCDLNIQSKRISIEVCVSGCRVNYEH